MSDPIDCCSGSSCDCTYETEDSGQCICHSTSSNCSHASAYDELILDNNIYAMSPHAILYEMFIILIETMTELKETFRDIRAGKAELQYKAYLAAAKKLMDQAWMVLISGIVSGIVTICFAAFEIYGLKNSLGELDNAIKNIDWNRYKTDPQYRNKVNADIQSKIENVESDLDALEHKLKNSDLDNADTTVVYNKVNNDQDMQHQGQIDGEELELNQQQQPDNHNNNQNRGDMQHQGQIDGEELELNQQQQPDNHNNNQNRGVESEELEESEELDIDNEVGGGPENPLEERLESKIFDHNKKVYEKTGINTQIYRSFGQIGNGIAQIVGSLFQGLGKMAESKSEEEKAKASWYAEEREEANDVLADANAAKTTIIQVWMNIESSRHNSMNSII